jgi:nicotinate-nucleotide adenylyltransferase
MGKLQPPLGILGGTFDPIHQGHLYIADCAFKQTPIKKIKIIPCYQPVHRSPPKASVEDRVAMVKLAIQGIPYLELDELEINRKGLSYTIDTLTTLRKNYPLAPISLILGTDAYQSITTWRRWQELLDYSHLLVLKRPHFIFSHTNHWLAEREAKDRQDLVSQKAGKIFFIEIPSNTISSTQVREKIKKGVDISCLVPIKVATYIKEHHLY